MHRKSLQIGDGNYVATEGLFSPAQKALSMVGAAAGAYHGYKRNKSVKWAVIWSLLGGLSPLIVGAVAVAQGFGKPKGQ